jgi:hypothetical protein
MRLMFDIIFDAKIKLIAQLMPIGN